MAVPGDIVLPRVFLSPISCCVFIPPMDLLYVAVLYCVFSRRSARAHCFGPRAVLRARP